MNEITFTLSPEGHYLPNLALPEDAGGNLGRFGRMRLDYLKQHRRVLYTALLTSGKLYESLREIDETAGEQMELLTAQMTQTEGVTEQLKAENQMLWVQRMNGIRNRAEEMIRDELVYC